MTVSLVVLAAGMGSRYGGLKQMDPIGPGGRFIPDYSVGDALAAGVSRIVFVIRPDIEKDFRDLVGRRWEARTDVRYAFQRLDDIPPPFHVPEGRVKPWGTGHALLSALPHIDDAAIMANADDYYGAEGFALLRGHLEKTAAEPATHAMVAYRLANTLSENGTVSRGICSEDASGALCGIVEKTALARSPDGCIRDASGPETYPDDTPVSMNLFGFKRLFLEQLSEDLPRFLAKYGTLPKSEFQVPTALASRMRRGEAKVEMLRTDARWFGVTAREDRSAVAEFLKTVPDPLA